MKYFNRSSLQMILISLLLSIVMHCVIIYRYLDGVLFTGKGDGIAQMLPFQMYLYEQFTQGNFFYNMSFGIGGDFFRSLAYYYSTSPVYYLNATSVFILDLFLPFDTHSIEFWAGNQIFVSLFKLALIIYITYGLLSYLNVNRYASMMGAVLYGYSTVYFFFTFTWSFFSDVMIYLPLTIWGIERLFRERKVKMFIIAIALTLHSNFYFSYYEFIFVLFYFIYRLVYANSNDIDRIDKLKIVPVASLIGLMIAAVGFYTGVSSYLLNDRSLPDFTLKPFIDFNILYNVFYNGYYVVIPITAVMALLTIPLYKHYYFRLFATITALFLIGSLSPLFDSFFNGFSIDQRRWVYLLVFSAGLLSALWLHYLPTISKKDLWISLIPVAIIYPMSMYGSGKVLPWTLFIPVVIVLFFILQQYKSRNMMIASSLIVIVMNAFFVHDYVTQQMDTLHPREVHDKAFIRSNDYNNDVQQQLVNSITKKHVNERIDWQTFVTHNTPMYQHFNGIKLYSSIFDNDIYQFYDKELEITMESDSNSIYYRLGNRQNLYSLFNVNHIIRNKQFEMKPWDFKVTDITNHHDYRYEVSENESTLPVVRVTNQVFKESELTTPIDREHAMLKGVVLKSPQQQIQSIKKNKNYIQDITLTHRDATYKNTTLNVTADNGGLTFDLPKEARRMKDIYVQMDIVLEHPNSEHYVWLNETIQSRKLLDDDYRRYNKTITMRVAPTDQIHLKLKKGQYQFKLKGIYMDDGTAVQKAAQEKNKHYMNNQGSKIEVNLKDHTEGYLVIPTPYLKGMTAKIDGKKTEVQEGNYLMTAIKVETQTKKVVLKYSPPYFHIMQFISLLGILLAIIYARRVKER